MLATNSSLRCSVPMESSGSNIDRSNVNIKQVKTGGQTGVPQTKPGLASSYENYLNENSQKYNSKDFSILTSRIFGSKKKGEKNLNLKAKFPYGVEREVGRKTCEGDGKSLIHSYESQSQYCPLTERQLRWNIRNFEIGPIRGRGKYGVVFKARLLSTKQVVALKVLNKQELEQDHMHEQLRKEVEIHSRLKHPNIVQLLGYFDDPKRVYLVLEYAAGGELYKHMKKQPNGRFTEEEAATYIAQLTSALSMCHCYNIIHRDVKPENLLLSADGRLKLADFGWAVHDRRGFQNYGSCGHGGIVPNLGSRRTTMCGTLDYLAPEMVNGHAYDESVDNWTVGVLAYELIVGYPPFESDVNIESEESDGQTLCGSGGFATKPQADDSITLIDSKLNNSLECENVATFRRITSLKYNCPKFMSPESKTLIRKLLNRDPALRLTLEEVLESPWIKKYARKVS